MPLRRTPPSTPTNSNAGQTVSHSDPNVYQSAEKESASSQEQVTQRSKRRKCAKDNSEADNFQAKIMEMFNELKTSMEGIKTQYSQLQNSVEFMGAKYDEFLKHIKKLEDEKIEDRLHIKSLEDKIDQLERQQRNASLEFRNLPKKDNETKTDLINLVVETTRIIRAPIQASEIKDVFRIKSKYSNETTIVDLCTVLTKENILSKSKLFNKENKDNKLNTSHLGKFSEKRPIYISENLPARTKRLFYLSREFASQNNFRFCWISYGKVFLRRKEGENLIRVETEKELRQLEGK